jgi:hypothetical protein
MKATSSWRARPEAAGVADRTRPTPASLLLRPSPPQRCHRPDGRAAAWRVDPLEPRLVRRGEAAASRALIRSIWPRARVARRCAVCVPHGMSRGGRTGHRQRAARGARLLSAMGARAAIGSAAVTSVGAPPGRCLARRRRTARSRPDQRDWSRNESRASRRKAGTGFRQEAMRQQNDRASRVVPASRDLL